MIGSMMSKLSFSDSVSKEVATLGVILGAIAEVVAVSRIVGVTTSSVTLQFATVFFFICGIINRIFT